MKNFKWGTKSFDNRPIYVVLFVSRHKDNMDIENFEERRMSFITHDAWNDVRLQTKFHEFVNRGKKDELSRMYVSINERDGAMIYKKLLLFLIENPEFNLCSIDSKLAGLAAQKECAKTKRWMFDFDSRDDIKLGEFLDDLRQEIGDETCSIRVHDTPHGYAIITDHGFDTRELVKKWPDVGLKRDDLLCVDWAYSENIKR